MVGQVGLAQQITSKPEVQKDLYWIKIAAKDKYERTAIVETGVSIETVSDDYVIVLGTQAERDLLQKKFNVLTSFNEIESLDFPDEDSQFHNYAELTAALQSLAKDNPDIVRLSSIGKSVENRDLWLLTITANQKNDMDNAGVYFMGAHHAREHLSVEVPLMIAQKLIKEYRSGDQRVQNYIQNRSIYIVPMVNPDGAEYDIATGKYRMWRKNRKLNDDGVYGVDLNRNYAYNWGTVGTSHSTGSDIYCGPGPFSEPETQAVKNFIETHPNITTVLTIHTFSKLILYPWGYTDNKIGNNRDFELHKTMARKMANWNGYKPQQSSDLYLTSGDTTDWTYGEKGLVSFTFELDPGSMWSGGFYPGQKVIQPVFDKNWEPALYLIEYADNPYRVIDGNHREYGLNTPLVQ